MNKVCHILYFQYYYTYRLLYIKWKTNIPGIHFSPRQTFLSLWLLWPTAAWGLVYPCGRTFVADVGAMISQPPWVCCHFHDGHPWNTTDVHIWRHKKWRHHLGNCPCFKEYIWRKRFCEISNNCEVIWVFYSTFFHDLLNYPSIANYMTIF